MATLRTSGFYSDQLTLSLSDIWALVRGVELRIGGLRIRFGERQPTVSFTDGRWSAPAKVRTLNYDGTRAKD